MNTLISFASVLGLLLAFNLVESFTQVPIKKATIIRLGSAPMTNDNNISKMSQTQIKPKDALGVIFDIDGTLADSWKLGFDATQVVLKNNNIETITEELYHECTRYCTPDRLARHAGLLPEDGDEFQTLGNKLALEFDELYVGLVSTKTACFYDGIEDLIMSLPQSHSDSDKKKVILGALTNACVAYAHAVLKTNCPILSNTDESQSNDSKTSSGVYKRFFSIHGADTVPKPKPDPSGLLQCCDEMGLDPTQCVYIGDSPSDAVAADNCGMVAIGVLWGSHPKESLKQAPFSYLCESVEELKALLIE